MHLSATFPVSRFAAALLIAFAVVCSGAAAQTPVDPTALAAQARRLTTNGRLDEAVSMFQSALAADPELFEAHLGLGIALDLQGRYGDAREHLRRALGRAPESGRGTALSALAVSYAFESKTDDAASFYRQLFDDQTAAGTLDGAAGTANALGRLYLELGVIDQAQAWYRTGHDTAKKLSGLPGDQVDLWEMRWLHAQSRLAARRGDRAAADTNAAALKALIDKGGENAKQLPIYQYLVGYNAFYLGNYEQAITELQRADQGDPFILALLARALEKRGDAAGAKEYWVKVLASNGHSLQNALVREQARQAVK